MEKHEEYMKRTIELAGKGWGRTNPNPLVGAVIVKNNKIIAEGWHKALGLAHAEISALNNAREDVKGAALYVNLEPCSHYGRTPPCVKAIIESGIGEVIIAMKDPNPKVAGRGIKILKDAGVKVTEGILKKEAEKLNEIFIKYITCKKPFVIMKTAMTMDGKIASYYGDSKWISGKSSRYHVHTIRDRVSAVMVGLNTVLSDDPLLTTRTGTGEGVNSMRVIADSKGSIPVNCRILKTVDSAGVVLATTHLIEGDIESELLKKGMKIIKTDEKDGHVNLEQLMNRLYEMEIDSVLLEGGGNLNASAMNAQIVDKVLFFIAPKIVGGKKAITPVEGEGIKYIKDAVQIDNISIKRFGEDILVEGYPCYC